MREEKREGGDKVVRADGQRSGIMSIFKWVSDIEEVPHKLAAETINSTARGAKNGQGRYFHSR